MAGIGAHEFTLLVHNPAWQASPCVQALPSLHKVPSATTGFEQRPVDALQTSLVQLLPSLQTTGVVPTH
jgi:hypothetical protein